MIFDETRLGEIFAPMSKQFVAIVGDVMLDRYIWGEVSRISPEAPVPVVDVMRESNHLGGAANVALNIKSLGANPVMFGVVGDDQHGDYLKRIFTDAGILTEFMVTDNERPTTVKTRIIAGSQHVVRIDSERRHETGEELTDRVLFKLEDHLGSISAIVLQDYNKGVVTKKLIRGVIDLAKSRNIPVCVDPKFSNFFEYEGVELFKPNRKETEDALNKKLSDENSFEAAAKEMQTRLSCKSVLLTLGSLGMLLLREDGSLVRVPTRARKVADVSGAGDTVIATLSVALAAGASMEEASNIANTAGGLVCEEIGIVPVNRDRLYDACLGRLTRKLDG
jgi:D-glycero-beta-D-manno-heptose-7-phosphate kinase